MNALKELLNSLRDWWINQYQVLVDWLPKQKEALIDKVDKELQKKKDEIIKALQTYPTRENAKKAVDWIFNLLKDLVIRK